MRTNLEDVRVRTPRLFTPSYDILRFNPTGSFIIPPEGPSIHFLDPGAADRTVFLPPIIPGAGQQQLICNLGTSKNLNVVDANGVAVAQAAAGLVVLFSSYATGWSALVGLSSASLVFLVQMQNWTRQTVTLAAGVGVATDSEIFFNRAGVIAFTLPDVESWFAAHTLMTSHLLLKDISGTASANNVTISAAGTDTIEGAASIPITGDWGGFKLNRLVAGKWGIVG